MKNRVISLLLMAAILLVGFSAASAHSHAPWTVLVNGVPVSSEGAHEYEGTVFVSIDAFDRLFSAPASVEELGTIHTLNGIATAPVEDLAAVRNAHSVTVDPEARRVYILALPEGLVPLHEHIVPGMGVHYANPAHLEIGGPVFCVFEGELYCIEYILPIELIMSGAAFTLSALEGLPSPSVVETVFDHNSTSLPVDHMAIHLYFFTAEERAHIQ